MTGVFVRLHFCQVFIILYFLFFCSAKLIVHASTIARKNEENAFFDEKCQKIGHFWGGEALTFDDILEKCSETKV